MIISKGRGYVYGIEYHIVFCTKYRKKILTNSVKDSLFQILIVLFLLLFIS
ncbi:MAG: transposase [Bacilli bacterium]|nr:transposase [Bacilli bacterium]